MLDIREKLLNKSAIKPVPRRIEALGEDAYFKPITCGDFVRLMELQITDGKIDVAKSFSHRLRVVALSLCNKDGTRAMSAAEVEQLSPEIFAELWKHAEEVNAVKADAVEEAKGNSSGNPSEDSSSVSQGTSVARLPNLKTA